jgi:hypothetical protein
VAGMSCFLSSFLFQKSSRYYKGEKNIRLLRDNRKMPGLIFEASSWKFLKKKKIPHLASSHRAVPSRTT